MGHYRHGCSSGKFRVVSTLCIHTDAPVAWQSLMLRRPPSLSLHHIDARQPEYEHAIDARPAILCAYLFLGKGILPGRYSGD